MTTSFSSTLFRLHRRAFAPLLALAFWTTALPARGDGGTSAAPAARPHVSSSSANDGWGVGRVAHHFRTRTGVVHVCILAVLGALYIMMRKLADGDPSPPVTPPTETLTEEHRDSATQQRRPRLG
jgi:hypothetical protein